MESDNIEREISQRNELFKKVEIETCQVLKVIFIEYIQLLY